MKISVAQIQPAAGDIQGNISLHKTWIERAIAEQAGFTPLDILVKKRKSDYL